MTGRTHDLAAFTALNIMVVTSPITEISLATASVSIGANLLGGLAPDIDQSTSSFWKHIRAGNVLGKMIAPLIGGHRFLSHSILGVLLVGFLLEYLLAVINNVLLVDMDIVWWAFMIGYISHLVADTFTRDGVPWFFPVPLRIGIPPFRFLRMKTGGLIESSIIFPGLLLFNFYIFYQNYEIYLDLFRNNLK